MNNTVVRIPMINPIVKLQWLLSSPSERMRRDLSNYHFQIDGDGNKYMTQQELSILLRKNGY